MKSYLNLYNSLIFAFKQPLSYAEMAWTKEPLEIVLWHRNTFALAKLTDLCPWRNDPRVICAESRLNFVIQLKTFVYLLTSSPIHLVYDGNAVDTVPQSVRLTLLPCAVFARFVYITLIIHFVNIIICWKLRKLIKNESLELNSNQIIKFLTLLLYWNCSLIKLHTLFWMSISLNRLGIIPIHSTLFQ